jgi:hypothetical protein
MSEVHDLVYHGQGGFVYDQVYNMPIQYRKYHIQKINDHLEKVKEAQEKTHSKQNVVPGPSQPNISPRADISTKSKAPKK